MVLSLSADEVRRLRVRAQRLDGRGHDDGTASDDPVADIARALAGLQAQDAGAADLCLRARGPDLTIADVKRAFVDDRSVVRSWLMRGTLHLVAAEDLGWMLGVLAPVAIDRSRRRMEGLGLDERTADHGVERLADVLAEGSPRTRADIAELLADDGIPLEGQALPHLIRYAALRGVLCNGPLRGGKSSYVRLDAWLGPELRNSPAADVASTVRHLQGERSAASTGDPPVDGLARLAGRYLAAFAPASLDDFTYWSGLRKRDARKGWDAMPYATVAVDAAGQPARLPADRVAWVDELGGEGRSEPSVRLTGMFDSYLLGYRSRDLALAPADADPLIPGTGGMIRASLLVDGRVRGAWKSRRQGGGIEVLLEPFGRLPAAVRAVLEREVEDVGRFLGVSAALTLVRL